MLRFFIILSLAGALAGADALNKAEAAGQAFALAVAEAAEGVGVPAKPDMKADLTQVDSRAEAQRLERQRADYKIAVADQKMAANIRKGVAEGLVRAPVELAQALLARLQARAGRKPEQFEPLK